MSGIIQMAAAYGARPGPPGVQTLSGEIFGSSGAGLQEARLEIRLLGQVFQWTSDFGLEQLDVATDWIIPNGAANSDFDVRYTNLSGDPLDEEPAAEDVWVPMSTTRYFGYTDNTSSPGIMKFGVFDVQIRWKGGSPLASGQYSITANRTS